MRASRLEGHGLVHAAASMRLEDGAGAGEIGRSPRVVVEGGQWEATVVHHSQAPWSAGRQKLLDHSSTEPTQGAAMIRQAHRVSAIPLPETALPQSCLRGCLREAIFV